MAWFQTQPRIVTLGRKQWNIAYINIVQAKFILYTKLKKVT